MNTQRGVVSRQRVVEDELLVREEGWAVVVLANKCKFCFLSSDKINDRRKIAKFNDLLYTQRET